MTELQHAAKKAIGLMDLTTLNEDDTDEKVIALCHQAHSAGGDTAAVCIYPRFVSVAKQTLLEQGTPHIRVATVTNFPHGSDDVELAVEETVAAVTLGANEVDVVFPYRALMDGNETVGFELVKSCKQVCTDANVLLKVIIESGELQEETLIRKASEICIDAGADFIKTSTGKVAVNATPETARIMLEVIREKDPKVGFKAAGGVRDARTAKAYMDLAGEILGDDWVNPEHFRFGASGLLGALLTELGLAEEAQTKGGY